MSIFRIFVIPACKVVVRARMYIDFRFHLVLIKLKSQYNIPLLDTNTVLSGYVTTVIHKHTHKIHEKNPHKKPRWNAWALRLHLFLVIVLIAVITFIPFLKSPPFYLQNHKYVDWAVMI